MLKSLRDYPYYEITKDSEYYPDDFKDLPNPPEKIRVLGNLELLQTSCIAIVGTRSSTDYGNELAHYFAKELSTHFTIVSGLATGIDQSAHKGTLQKGKTIAIIAGSFQSVIRPSNYKIAKDILDNGGAILTEYDEETHPLDFTFLERNRLIAALSQATIVIEAPSKSGALNTAKHAKKLEKPLFVIPWSLNYYKGMGNNTLLRNGAIPLIEINQIYEVLFKDDSQICLFDTKIDSKEALDVPDEFIGYYSYIKENGPVTLEQIASFFSKDTVGDISSNLVIMELNSYIRLKDNLYYV